MTVQIVTRGDRTQSIEIGAEDGQIFFSDDPVEITSGFNDSFDVLIRNEAAIRLLVRDFAGDLFCPSCRDAVVNIFKGSDCVFAGFVEPQAYSQGYNDVWEELTINCIDALSALQYSKYKDLQTPGNDYKTALMEATVLSMSGIISSIINGLTTGLRINGSGVSRIWYDGCRSMGSTKDYAIFSRLGVAEILFLGSEEDDVWDQQEVLTEILKYLNLHITQAGFDFYIFSWETVAGSEAIVWHDLGSSSAYTCSRSTVEISQSNVVDTDTTISIGETFNRIELTCELKDQDLVIESPLDQTSLTSPYSGRQLYMREYVVEGSGKNGAINAGNDEPAFQALWQGNRTTHKGAYTRDWYLRVMNHPSWIFPDKHTGEDLISKYCQNNANQQNLPNQLAKQIGACLVSWGSVKEPAYRTDDAVPSKLEMGNALVVSVNGQRTSTAYSPSEAAILASAPVAFYTGTLSGGTYSPNDDDTTNYIVFSGKIATNMLPKAMTDNPYTAYLWPENALKNRTGEGSHLYGRRFFKAATPKVHATVDTATHAGLFPFSEIEAEYLKYELSDDGTDADNISKIPMLRCMLIIGNKCVVETGPGSSVNDFEWKPFKERNQCEDDDEYYAQSFTLGFNPAIGDYILNSEHDISNNIPYYLGIDAEGTAIPIKRSDALTGKVRFMIVGPVNSVWDATSKEIRPWKEVILSHTYYQLLAYMCNIIVKDFEVKLYSDNGGDEITEECDLVYMSDTDEAYINKKDDLTFRISSALTTAERNMLKVSEAVRYSTVTDLQTGLGVTRIFDHVKGVAVKAEQSYVDSYYAEHHKPRITMQQRLKDTDVASGLFRHYLHPAMPQRIFYVQAVGRNLRLNEAILTLKEVWL